MKNLIRKPLFVWSCILITAFFAIYLYVRPPVSMIRGLFRISPHDSTVVIHQTLISLTPFFPTLNVGSFILNETQKEMLLDLLNNSSVTRRGTRREWRGSGYVTQYYIHAANSSDSDFIPISIYIRENSKPEIEITEFITILERFSNSGNTAHIRTFQVDRPSGFAFAEALEEIISLTEPENIRYTD